MPLGPQFTNTYWEDPKSKSVMSSTELPTPKGELPTMEQRKPQIAEGFGTSDNPQGMLFSPHSYTGLKDDPTVPAEQRMGAINKALHLQSMDELQKFKDSRIQTNKDRDAFNRDPARLVDKKPYRKPLSVPGDITISYGKNKALGEAANNLDIPTRQYETGIDANTHPTDWHSGWASWGEIHVGVRKNEETGYEANERTLAHEIGHTLEPPGDEPQKEHIRRDRRKNSQMRTDPVSEGYADSLMDRAHHYSGQFEKHLTNPQLRAKDISLTGYSSKYHLWNAEERALYSAVRFHVAAHPERIEGMKNRRELERNLYGRFHFNNNLEVPTTKLMLGHMYENMPHVRPLLHELGFGRTSKKAHETFMSRTETPSAMRGSGWRGKQREVYEQPELPGL